MSGSAGAGARQELQLRLTDDAVESIEAHLARRFADSRAGMAVIWLTRWSKYHFRPDLASWGPVVVRLSVEVDPVALAVVKREARAARVAPGRLASSVINEHGHHARANACDGLMPLPLEEYRPCWCGRSPRSPRASM